jgi:hypothetical protein
MESVSNTIPKWYEDYLRSLPTEQANELLYWLDMWRPDLVVIKIVKCLAKAST